MRETITVKVNDYKKGPSNARMFGGSYNGIDKIWTIRKTGLAAEFWAAITGDEARFRYGFYPVADPRATAKIYGHCDCGHAFGECPNN